MWQARLHPRDPRSGEFVNSNFWINRASSRIDRQLRGARGSKEARIARELQRSDRTVQPRRIGGQDLTFYHGTVLARLKAVLPAAQHRGSVIFPHDTNPEFAYATPDLDVAWHYAEKAWNAAARGIPRVFKVRATGPIEKDPEYDQHGRHRSNFESDIRSRWKFVVLEEVPMPESMGNPRDWR